MLFFSLMADLNIPCNVYADVIVIQSDHKITWGVLTRLTDNLLKRNVATNPKYMLSKAYCFDIWNKTSINSHLPGTFWHCFQRKTNIFAKLCCEIKFIITVSSISFSGKSYKLDYYYSSTKRFLILFIALFRTYASLPIFLSISFFRMEKYCRNILHTRVKFKSSIDFKVYNSRQMTSSKRQNYGYKQVCIKMN